MRFLSLSCLAVFLACAARAQDYAPKFPPYENDAAHPGPHPAIVAARWGDAEKVRKFLADGVSVNACDSEGQTMVRAALEFKRVDLARELMGRGFNPNLVYRYREREELVEIGNACLTAAVRAGAEDIFDTLIAKGMATPVYTWDPNGLGDPITLAVEGDHVSILRKLLKTYGAARGPRTMRQLSYVYLAPCKSVPALEALLDAGVDVDAEGGPVESVLHTYARRGWAEGVALLLARGANASASVGYPTQRLPEEVAATPEIARQLHAAAALKHLAPAPRDDDADEIPAAKKSPAFPSEVLAAILQGDEAAAIARAKNLTPDEINATDNRGWIILNYALKEKKTRLARALIAAGADVAHFTTAGSAIIGFAVETRDVALVQEIAAKGVKVDAAKPGNWTALMVAVDQHELPMVEALLALGAKVDPPRSRYALGEKWCSALQIAARTGDVKLIQRMIDAGGDLHAVDSTGENVLSWAVRSGKVEAMQYVVQLGLSPHTKTAEGLNALTLAASLGHTDMAKALLALGVTHPDARRFAEMGGHFATRDALIAWKQQQNPDDPVDFWNRRYLTPAEIRAYLAKGGDVNFSEAEQTPLQHMAHEGDLESVRLLFDAGANANLTTRNTYTPPVFFAFYNHEPRDDDKALALLRLFIEHGASPNARELLEVDDPDHPHGSTLVTFAAALSYWKCVRYLLDKGANPSIRDGFGHRNAFDELTDCRKLDATERVELRALLEAHAQPDPDEMPRPVPSLLARPKPKTVAL